MSELPIKVEGIIARRKDDVLEFLIFKRSLADGGFWQPLTGTLEYTDSIEQCLIRELDEETGIAAEDIQEITPEVYRFNWVKKGFTVVEIAYGVLVDSNVVVRLSDEHTEYRWCEYEEASMSITMSDNREAMNRTRDYFETYKK